MKSWDILSWWGFLMFPALIIELIVFVRIKILDLHIGIFTVLDAVVNAR